MEELIKKAAESLISQGPLVIVLGAAVYWLAKLFVKQTDALGDIAKDSTKAIQNNTDALDNLNEKLNNRPCLMKEDQK